MLQQLDDTLVFGVSAFHLLAYAAQGWYKMWSRSENSSATLIVLLVHTAQFDVQCDLVHS